MTFPAGVPALLVLLVTCIAGIGIGHALPKVESFSSVDPVHHGLRNKIRIHSFATGFVAGVFWLWALRNTIVAGLDLGICSFLVAVCAAANGIRVAGSGEPEAMSIQRYYFCFACFLVAANYLLALFAVASGTWLWSYMLVGVLAWAINGLWGVILINSVQPEATPLLKKGEREA